MRLIIYTRHDGGVSTNSGPSAEVLQAMQFGGYWNEFPRGFIDKQIDKQIEAGIAPDHAARFARAVAFGGITEAEAWDIIKDRDCARHGTQHEMIDVSDLPDRWFRDAWRRSANGGPPSVDLEKARPIQWRRIVSAVNAENKRRSLDLFGKSQIRLPKVSLQSAIKNARDDVELRRIWPESLPR